VNLVTVVGHYVSTLKHQLEHYAPYVDDVFVNVHRNSLTDEEYEKVVQITKDFGCGIHKEVEFENYNWNRVTDTYNETKLLKPDEWWIIADDDELHHYQNPIQDIVDNCEDNNWKFVTGAFLDRFSIDGSLNKVTDDKPLDEQFPLGGWFRFIVSNNCPNKVVLSKGEVQVSSGQHYALIGDKEVRTTENSRIASGVNHEYRCPVDWEFTQVHHFKWDYTVVNKLNEIVKVDEPYAYSFEYDTLREYFEFHENKINIKDPNFRVENVYENKNYSQWDFIKKTSLHF